MVIERTVELVTPCFPGGADTKIERDDLASVEVEGVRAAAIVYGMRWWFRALAGAIRGTGDLEGIRTAESAIFGTAQNIRLKGTNFEGLASRVRVTVLENVLRIKNFEPGTDQLWLRYLAYGLYKTDRADTWVRKWVEEGATFKFRLQVTGPRGGRETVEPEIPVALVETLADLWIEFGGVGARWRHGLGGMRLNGSPDLGSGGLYRKQVMKKLADAEALVGAFLKTLELPEAAVPGPTAMPSFPVVQAPHFRVAWRASAGPDAREALATVHSIWRGTRRLERREARSSSQNVEHYKAMAVGGLVNALAVKFAGLGLPIPFGFPQLGPTMNGSVKPAESTRRASPIWFRVIRVNSKQYGLLAMLWDCEYLPGTEGVVMHMNGDPDDARQTVELVKGEAVAYFDGLVKNEHFVEA